MILSISIFAKNEGFKNTVSSYEKSLNSNENIIFAFNSLNDFWRELVDETPSQIAKVEIFGALKSSSFVISKDINEHFEKLVIIGNLRGRFLEKEMIKNYLISAQRIDLDSIKDLKRELKLVPMKFFAQLLLQIRYVKENLNQGLKGIKNLLGSIFTYISLLFVPILLWFFLRKLKNKLKVKSIELGRYRFQSNSHYRKYKLLSFTTSYLIDFLLFVFFRYLRVSTDSLSFLFAIGEIYFLYKIVISFTYSILGFVFNKTISKEDNRNFDLKKKVFSKKVGRFFLAYSLIYHLIQYVVGGGITSLLLIWIIKLNILFLIILISLNWKEEIVKSLEARNDFLSQKLYLLIMSRNIPVLPLFGFVYLIVIRVLNFLLKQLERFDIIKQLSAKLFKRKLISTENFVEEENIRIPDEYLSLFKDQASEKNIIEPKSSFTPEVIEHINAWLNNPNEENSIAICGHKGSGKTTLLDRIEKQVNSVKFLRIHFNERVTSETQLINIICSNLGLEGKDSIVSLLKESSNIEKTIVFLEGCHNLFLSELDGFKAYKKLLEITNSRLSNIFWIGTFNQNAWNYLTAVYGKNEGFRFVFHLKGWSDSDIKKLILTRHELSSYSLSFDRILKAVGNSENESLEEVKDQFFRVLWEQSQGNPQVANYLWLSSLTFKSNNRIVVGLPKNDDIKEISKFTDNVLFTFSAIVKHENLSVSEIVKVTGIEQGIVRHAIKLGLENEFLLRDDKGHYSMFVRYNYRIINFLRKKNLIIGN